MLLKARACTTFIILAGLLAAVAGCLPVAAPGVPALLTPSDGAVIDGDSVSFSWSSASQATQYKPTVCVDPSLTASSLVFQSSVGEATQITLESFDSGTTYYWTVWASNSAGDSPAAPTRSFTTGGGGTGAGPTARVWTKMSESRNAFFTSVWGRSWNNVYAAGWSGVIIHYNGTIWSKMATPADESLFDLWGFTGGSVFAVGSNGSILRLSGGTWAQMPYPLSIGTSGEPLPTLRSIWGASPTDILVDGDGTLHNTARLHFNGTDWHQCAGGGLSDMYSIWGSSANDVFAAGFNGIFHSTAP